MYTFTFTHPHVVVVFFWLCSHAPRPTQGTCWNCSLSCLPPCRWDLLVSRCPLCVSHVPWPPHLLTWPAKAREPRFKSVNSRAPFLFLRAAWLNPGWGVSDLTFLTWFLSWKPQTRREEFLRGAPRLFALRVLFEWPSPLDKAKLKYSNVPGPQTLLPPSLHVSSYLYALPTLPLLPHTPPTPPGLACYRYAGFFFFPRCKFTSYLLLRFTSLRSGVSLHLKFYPDLHG